MPPSMALQMSRIWARSITPRAAVERQRRHWQTARRIAHSDWLSSAQSGARPEPPGAASRSSIGRQPTARPQCGIGAPAGVCPTSRMRGRPPTNTMAVALNANQSANSAPSPTPSTNAPMPEVSSASFIASCGTPGFCRCTVRHQQGQGGAHLVPAPHRVRRGSTSRVSNSMHDHRPPTTGAAVRADTSAPTPASHNSGKRPRTVVATVITSGRTRALAPSTTAASTSSGFWMRPSRMRTAERPRRGAPP